MKGRHYQAPKKRERGAVDCSLQYSDGHAHIFVQFEFRDLFDLLIVIVNLVYQLKRLRLPVRWEKGTNSYSGLRLTMQLLLAFWWHIYMYIYQARTS